MTDEDLPEGILRRHLANPVTDELLEDYEESSHRRRLHLLVRRGELPHNYTDADVEAYYAKQLEELRRLPRRDAPPGEPEE